MSARSRSAQERDFQEWARGPGGLWWEVEGLKQQGNQCINHSPRDAVMFYSRAIDIDRDPSFMYPLLTARERATLFSNRCTAWMKLGDFGEAFENAITCINMDPDWQKGYWRMAMVMKQMNKLHEALEALIDGYPRIHGTDGTAMKDRLEFLYEITVLTVRQWDVWQKSQYLFRALDADKSVWTLVVQRLAKNKDYQALRLVFLGGVIQSGRVYKLGEGGSATGCDTSSIDLKPLVRGFTDAHKAWSMHLVLELIKYGSKVVGLTQKEGDTPLHCALENVLITGWVNLLQHLFCLVYLTSESRNFPDRYGDSLFHLVARTKGPATHAKVAVNILQTYSVDPTRFDRLGRRPPEVAPQEKLEIRGLLNASCMVWSQKQYGMQQQQRLQQQQQQQQWQQQQEARNMLGQRFPGPQHSNPQATSPNSSNQATYFQSTPRAQSQFFDPSRIFGGNPHRPRGPRPFFDHTRLFGGQKKPTRQEEEMLIQKEECQRLQKQRQQEEEMRKKQEEEAKRRREEEMMRKQREEQEFHRRQRQEEEWRRQQQEEEKKRRQRLEEERKKKKEKERQDRLRSQREEKKNREYQKKKERKELKKKKEEEAKLNAFQDGLSLQSQGKHSGAVCRFLEFISTEHSSSVTYRDVDRCVRAFLESLDHVQEIPETVQCAAPASFWDTSVRELADAGKWWSLFLLLVGGSYSASRSNGGIAHGCDASNVSIVSFLRDYEKMTIVPGRKAMVKALLENKARPNGLVNDPVTPLLHCLQMENYELVNLLLSHGAAPSLLVVDQGDTPLHSALKIGFKQDDRKFTMLDLLLTKYSSDTTSTLYLDKNAQDLAGNTLLHVALTEGTKNQSLNAVKLLSKHKLNPRLRNSRGKVPLSMVTTKDRRYMFMADVAKHYREPESASSKATDWSDQGGSSDGIKVYGSGIPDEWTERDGRPGQDHHHRPHSPKSPDPISTGDRLRGEVENLISDLPIFVPKQLDEVEVVTTTLRSPPRDDTRQPVLETTPRQDEAMDHEEPTAEDEEEEIIDAEEKADDDEQEISEIDANIFDDLAWEVECTAKVWKFLRDKQFPHALKETFVRKIQMLGNGDWRGRLCKPLEGLPKQHNMKLYEARLTKGGRILWELAIAFSPRCSEECDRRLESGDAWTDGSAVAGGRVYSEIIRIWDIVPDHPKVAHAIEVIVNSVERGEQCIIRKNLVGMGNRESTGGMTGLRLPTYFREVTGNSPDRGGKSHQEEDAKIPKRYFPPASAKENEYHIMKFYSVTSTLVNAVLNDTNVKVDFPFRVTELEHAIINLQPKPPSSILLLGRSGTGKTTCCLYRMWTKFFKYWKQASEIGEPWIPRDIAFVHQDEMDEGDGTSNSDDDVDTYDSSYQNGSSEPNMPLHKLKGAGDTSMAVTNMTGSGDYEVSCNGGATPTIMDHLHQVFITKNAVLCSEVQRNFIDMSHACEFAAEPLAQQDTPLPHRFEDAHQARFPLFLSSRQFLLLLDASLPGPYFPRAADGSLKRKIRGWDEEDGPLTFIPLLDDEEEEDLENASGENDQEPEGALGEDEQPHKLIGHPGVHHDNQGGGTQATKYDPRREVTYDVFAYELWPRIKKKMTYHPTLVWMEITSFIKGSVEALHTESGHLSLKSYCDLGRKRASNFTADREEIYKLFKAYEHEKSQRNLFDEGDLVFHVYRRLRDIRQLDWAIHEVYVDETQDFTQAELALFIRCSHDPNSLFLTGDTAQSIMRGVAFRFDDLKSLFHYASKSVKALGKHSAVTVPKKVYQLTHNYRSHAGILNLASKIVDLMTHFFPNSFDRLERDQGLFHGPPPVLLESCSFSDLALLLSGNKRKTSEIEFGAHQVILVANEEAIDRLPDELRLGLVMTIYEAKGLEFDDVLLYNFFKDSPADKEWRVITDYLNELRTQSQSSSDESSTGLKQINLESLNSADRPRPLKFDPDKHKVLNSELKYLYTAITRARVNVWIFDEDVNKRAPMFELMRLLSLVKVISPDTGNEAASPDLDAMFVEKSTPAEWLKRGDYFFQNKLWLVAAKCYHRGGDEEKTLRAQAHQEAMEAERQREHLHAMREKFLRAASLFLKCNGSRMAVNCLYNAREYRLLAQLYEKRGEYSKAASIYEKRLNSLSDACRCLEQNGDYAKTLDLLCSIGLHTKALDVMDRFQRFKEELGGKPLPRRVKPPWSTHSQDQLIYKSAEYHYRHDNRDQMLDALEGLGQLDARVNFLRARELFTEAVAMLKEEGQLLEAAKILRQQGKLEEACTILESSDNPQFVAECQLSQARKLLVEAEDEENHGLAVSLLLKAEALFQRCDDSARKAETWLLLGRLQSDAEKVRKAKNSFNGMSHIAGESECTDALIKLSPITSSVLKSRVFQPLEHLLQLICALFECKTPEEERHRLLCEEFFGLVSGEAGKLHIQRSEGARVVSALRKNFTEMSEIDADKVREDIAVNRLIPRALKWVKQIRELLHEERKKQTQCGDYVIGIPCRQELGTCPFLHEPHSLHSVKGLVSCLVRLIELDDIMEKASRVSSFKTAERLTAKIEKVEKNRSMICKSLYDLFYPKHCHHRFIGQSSATLQEILRMVRSQASVKKQLKAYAERERMNAKPLYQRADTDLYLLCHGIHLLVGEGSKILDCWVTQEENACLTWQQEEGWKHPYPPGMHLTKRGGKDAYLSYKRRHLESFNDLYGKEDVMECLCSFNRFMGDPVNRPMIPLLPSIGNTVSMIEAKVTMMLTIGAKATQCYAAVPASYLAQATFLDAVNHGGRAHAMYKAVSNSIMDKQNVNGQIRGLADKICGSGKAYKFNVLGDAFSSVEYVNSGEAERALVLALVTLCNAGLALPFQIIGDIRRALQTIAPSKDRLPGRVHKALCDVQSAENRHDVLHTLHHLLKAREDEYLRACKWNPHMPPRGSPGLEYEAFNVKCFPNVAFDKMNPVAPTVFTEQLAGNMTQRGKDIKDGEVDDMTKENREASFGDSEDEEREEMGLEVSEEEAAKVKRDQDTLQKQTAAKTIIRVLKKGNKIARLLRLASLLRSCGCRKVTVREDIQVKSEKAASEWVSKQLLVFTHISTRCTICGVNLQRAQEFKTDTPKSLEEEEDTEDNTEESASSWAGQDLQPAPDAGSDLPTQEEHEATLAHKETNRQFLDYGIMLRDEVYPIYIETGKLLNELHFPSIGLGTNSKVDDLQYFKEGLSSCLRNLQDQMERISKMRAFEQLEEIRHSVRQLTETYDNAKARCQIHEDEQQGSEEPDYESTAAGKNVGDEDTMDIEEGDDADESKILPVVEQPEKRKGRRTKGKNTRKGKWNRPQGKRR